MSYPPQSYPPPQGGAYQGGGAYPPPNYPPPQGGAYQGGGAYPPPNYPPPQGGAYPPPNYPPPMGAYAVGPPQPGYGAPPPNMGMGVDTWGIMGAARKIVIEQETSLLEMLADAANCCEACCEQPNKYKITDERGTHIMTIKEESEFMNRCCCNPCHELKLHAIHPQTNQELLTMDRPMKCGGPCPVLGDCCQHEITAMRDGQFVGRVVQPVCGGGCKPALFVGTNQDPETNFFAKIEGPTCCFGGVSEMCCDQEFKLSNKGDGSDDMGTIKKVPAGVQEALGDADTYHMTFANPSMDANQKMTLLASLLLLDYMFFEQNSPFECNPCADPGETCCSVTLFEMYCCGCLLPCTLSCDKGLEEDGGDGGIFD